MKLTQKAIIGYVLATILLALVITGLLLPQVYSRLSITEAAQGIIDTANPNSPITAPLVGLKPSEVLVKLFDFKSYEDLRALGFFNSGILLGFGILSSTIATVAFIVIPMEEEKKVTFIRSTTIVLALFIVALALNALCLDQSVYLADKYEGVGKLNKLMNMIISDTNTHLVLKSGMGSGLIVLIVALVTSIGMAINPRWYVESK